MDKVIELRDKLDGFKDRFIVDLAIEMRIKQGLVFVSILIVRLVWFVITDAIAHGKSALAASITIRLQATWNIVPVRPYTITTEALLPISICLFINT